jgi:SNF2 family DNA or RNA helicase
MVEGISASHFLASFILSKYSYRHFRFVNRFAKPIEEARDKDASSYTMRMGEKANLELQKFLRPYFLQRLKIDFLADKLPSKRDFVVWTHLSRKQRSMYEKYVDSGESAVASVLSGESTSPLEAITWLKKLCGHPILVDKRNQTVSENFDDHDPEELVKESAKLQVLVELIDRLRRLGHRTLIFSQSTRMLDIIERVLYRVNLSRIDGSTKEKDRQKRVDDFNSNHSDVEVMLLSTKAAGIGLTLTGADRCIVYDPSWNPA